MGTSFGPNYSNNAALINGVVSGATILATNLNSVLTDLNLSGYSMGVSLGPWASFAAPFSQNLSIIENIIAGYTAAVSLVTGTTTSVDVGARIYKYKNLGGF